MRASRLLSIMMLLQAKGRMSAESLSEELEVSVRTIYRDIDQLSAAGVPVYADIGRNGGFALTWWSKIPTLVKRFGEEDAFRLAKLSEEAVTEIGAFCEREGIDANFHQGGWLWTATSPAPPGPPNPPAIGPRRRTSSYSLRLSVSPSTSYAAEISLNRSSRPGLASGWFSFASFRYARVMSFGAAVSGTPSTS